MKKEIRTKEEIKHELFNWYLDLFKFAFLLLLLTIIVLCIAICVTLWNHGEINWTSIKDNIPIWILWLMIWFLTFFSFFESLRYILIIEHNKFRIVTDILVDTKVKKFEFSPGNGTPRYVLRFATHGEYIIPDGKNYKKSKMFCMKSEGVYNYSTVGDEFYLVIINRNNVIMAYNKKLFEIRDNHKTGDGSVIDKMSEN